MSSILSLRVEVVQMKDGGGVGGSVKKRKSWQSVGGDDSKDAGGFTRSENNVMVSTEERGEGLEKKREETESNHQGGQLSVSGPGCVANKHGEKKSEAKRKRRSEHTISQPVFRLSTRLDKMS